MLHCWDDLKCTKYVNSSDEYKKVNDKIKIDNQKEKRHGKSTIIDDNSWLLIPKSIQ